MLIMDVASRRPLAERLSSRRALELRVDRKARANALNIGANRCHIAPGRFYRDFARGGRGSGLPPDFGNVR
jgi:hypothetical protein